jgi:hypothetical protein
MLAGKIAHLTVLRLVWIAWIRLTSIIGIEVTFGGRAVAVSAHWELVDMVDWSGCQREDHRIAVSNSRNGPPSLGKFEMLTSKLTPVPLVLELATTEPLTGLPLGRTAMYLAPCGLSRVTGALPARIIGRRASPSAVMVASSCIVL